MGGRLLAWGGELEHPLTSPRAGGLRCPLICTLGFSLFNASPACCGAAADSLTSYGGRAEMTIAVTPAPSAAPPPSRGLTEPVTRGRDRLGREEYWRAG